MEYIPVVDLSKISIEGPISATDLAETAEELFHALYGIGFAFLSNHGISKDIIDKAFTVSKGFFELPQEVKEKSLKDTTKSYTGYAKPGQELLAPGSTYEVRESFDLYGNLGHFPESSTELRAAMRALEGACKPLAKSLLRVLALALKPEDKEYFVSRSRNVEDRSIPSYTTLRSLYYPPVPSNIPASTVRCAEHTDYGMLTMLFQDDIGGLEVKTVSGKWVPATPIPGTILLNTGDLLEFWSGGKFPATWHQVKIPEAEKIKRTHRQSIAYFIYPDNGVLVSPLTGNSCEYEVVSVEDHAKKRLVSSYVY